MKVSELEGALLDAWVVKALGAYRGPYQLVKDGRPEKNCLIFPGGVPFRATTGNLMPSSDWSHGGPIIESERIDVSLTWGYGVSDAPWYEASLSSHEWPEGYAERMKEPRFATFEGPTLLVAAMRAFVASKYGEEVPDE